MPERPEETEPLRDASAGSTGGVCLREEPVPADSAAIRAVVEATGVFRPDEIDVAVELVSERLAKGPASGYSFLIAELPGAPPSGPVGYACYGPIACTIGRYDLYWIAVLPSWQGKGLGRLLLQEAESRIVRDGGQRIYIETSSRPQYAATRRFYERNGYVEAATLKDFYAPGDDKVVYAKDLTRRTG